jgi:glycyl-tRNA synthetase beta chain
LKAFLDSEDGANLKAAYMRANGICAQAKHDDDKVDAGLLSTPEEQQLHQAIVAMADDAAADYQSRLDMLANLRGPVDAFFEAVMVNDEDKKIRHNRLSLLKGLVNLMRRLADFDLVE